MEPVERAKRLEQLKQLEWTQVKKSELGRLLEVAAPTIEWHKKRGKSVREVIETIEERTRNGTIRRPPGVSGEKEVFTSQSPLSTPTISTTGLENGGYVPRNVRLATIRTQPLPTRSIPSMSSEGGTVPVLSQIMDELGRRVETIDQANRRLRTARADAQELENKRKRLELVQLEVANAHFSGVFVRIQEMGRQVGGQTCDAVAAESDPVKCKAIIDAEIERVLAELKTLVLDVEETVKKK